jgi:hypothetical protein
MSYFLPDKVLLGREERKRGGEGGRGR